MTDIALGIDIGGTKIFHALVNKNGEIVSEIKKDFTPKTAIEIEKKLKEIIADYENQTQLAGIASAGACDLENKKILSSTANMPENYRNINFKALNDKVEVVLENDANCSAWAEFKTGTGKGLKNIVVLTLGTGVGGGIIVNGSLLKGKSGAAGEMHFKMHTEEKRKCTCGAYDCFEVYASGYGLKLTYKDITGEDISTYEIIEKYNNNEENAKKALKRWNEYIAMGAVGLNDIFDTELIAFTGSMAEFADIKFIEEYINKYTVTTKTKAAKCTAGNFAGLIGAALIAFEKKTQANFSQK